MRYLGVDYGRKRIGLAIGQKGLAAPLAVYPLDRNIYSNIKKICDEEAINEVVLGISSSLEKEIKIFGQKLKESLDLPVVLQDETLTTVEAIGRMIVSSTKKKSRRKKNDAVAAAQILVSYFTRAKNLNG